MLFFRAYMSIKTMDNIFNMGWILVILPALTGFSEEMDPGRIYVP